MKKLWPTCNTEDETETQEVGIFLPFVSSVRKSHIVFFDRTESQGSGIEQQSKNIAPSPLQCQE